MLENHFVIWRAKKSFNKCLSFTHAVTMNSSTISMVPKALRAHRTHRAHTVCSICVLFNANANYNYNFPACYIYIFILSSQSQSIEWNMQNTPIYVTLQYRLHHLTRWHGFVFKSECYFSQQFRPIYIKRAKEWVFDYFEKKRRRKMFGIHVTYPPFFAFLLVPV